MTGCFSSELFSFELVLGPDQALVRFSRSDGKDCGVIGEQRVPASVAADFIAKINAVLAREERGSGARYTTAHFARIAEGEAGSAPLLDRWSNDMPRDFLEEAVADPATLPALAERIRAALAQDPFNRAFAVVVLARQLAQQLGYGPLRASGMPAAQG